MNEEFEITCYCNDICTTIYQAFSCNKPNILKII